MKLGTPPGSWLTTLERTVVKSSHASACCRTHCGQSAEHQYTNCVARPLSGSHCIHTVQSTHHIYAIAKPSHIFVKGLALQLPTKNNQRPSANVQATTKTSRNRQSTSNSSSARPTGRRNILSPITMPFIILESHRRRPRNCRSSQPYETLKQNLVIALSLPTLLFTPLGSNFSYAFQGSAPLEFPSLHRRGVPHETWDAESEVRQFHGFHAASAWHVGNHRSALRS